MSSIKSFGMIGREEARKGKEESKGKEPFIYMYLLGSCFKGQ